MKKKDKILSGALLLSFKLFAQPPAPGSPPPPGLSIDIGIIVLFIAGIILGIYKIVK